MKIPSPKKEESKHKIDINKTYPNLLTCGILLEHATYAKDISKYNEIKFDYESKKTVRQDHLQASQDLVDETTALQSIKDGKWHIMSKDYTDTEQKIIAYQNDKQIVLTFGTCIFRTKKGTASSVGKNAIKDRIFNTDYPTKKMELTFGRKTQLEPKHEIYINTTLKLAKFAIDNECNLTIVAAQETCILAKYASLAIAKSGIKADTRIMLFDNCGIMMEAHHQTIVINNKNNGITNNLYSNSFLVEGHDVTKHTDLNESVSSILAKLNPNTGYFTNDFKIAADIPAKIVTNTEAKPSNAAEIGFWIAETTFAVIGLGAIATGVGAPIALACGIGAIVVSKILKPKYNSDTKQTIRDCVKALITSQDESTQDESTIVSYEQYQKQSKEKVTKSYTVLHDLEFRDDKCISKIFIPRNKIHHMWELLSSKKIIASVLKDTFHENPRIEKLLLLIKAQYEFRIEKNNEQQTFFIIKSTDDAQDIFQIEAALFKLFNTYNEVEILKELSSKVNFQSNFREELMNITQQIAEANEVLSNQIEAIKTAQNAIRLLEKQEQDGNKESFKQIKAQKNIIAIQYYKIKKYCETAKIDFVILDRKITDQLELGLIAYRVQDLEKELQDTRKQLEKAKKAITDNKNQSSDNKNQISNLTLKVTTLEKQLAELKTEPIKLKNSISDIDLNDNFVGRTDEQQIIQKLLEDDNTKVIAVTGVGGIGKSTLCAEVAGFLATPLTQRQSGRLTSDKLNSISTDLNESEWCAHTFDARSEEDLFNSFLALAQDNKIFTGDKARAMLGATPEKQVSILKEITSKLEKHLKENGKQFLFIFDNVNDIKDIEQYLNYAGKNIKILVNSRDGILPEEYFSKPIIKLPPLLSDDYHTYLEHRFSGKLTGDDKQKEELKNILETISVEVTKDNKADREFSPYTLNKVASYLSKDFSLNSLLDCIKTYKGQMRKPQVLKKYIMQTDSKYEEQTQKPKVMQPDSKFDFDEMMHDIVLNELIQTYNKVESVKRWEILQHISYLDGKSISFDLILKILNLNYPNLTSEHVKTYVLPLLNLSFVKYIDTSKEFVQIHDLDRKYTKDFVTRNLIMQQKSLEDTNNPDLSDNENSEGKKNQKSFVECIKPQQIISNLTKILNDSIKDDDINDSNWSEVLKYTSHAKSVLDEINIESYSELLNDESWLKDHSEFVHNAAILNNKMGKHAILYSRQAQDALLYCKTAFAYIEKIDQDASKIHIMHSLARAHSDMNSKNSAFDAIKVYEDAISVAEKHYGIESPPYVAKSLFNIALLQFIFRIIPLSNVIQDTNKAMAMVQKAREDGHASEVQLLAAYKSYILFNKYRSPNKISESLSAIMKKASELAQKLHDSDEISDASFKKTKILIEPNKAKLLAFNNVSKLLAFDNACNKLLLQGKFKEIIDLCEKAQNELDMTDPDVKLCMFRNAAAVCVLKKQPKIALAYYNKQLEILRDEKQLTEDNIKILDILSICDTLQKQINPEQKITVNFQEQLDTAQSILEHAQTFHDNKPHIDIVRALKDIYNVYHNKFIAKIRAKSPILECKNEVLECTNIVDQMIKIIKQIPKEDLVVGAFTAQNTLALIVSGVDILKKLYSNMYIVSQNLGNQGECEFYLGKISKCTVQKQLIKKEIGDIDLAVQEQHATKDTANDIGDNKAIDNAIEEKQQIAETASQEPASIENLIGGSANDNNADPTNTASLSGESTENADHG